MSLHQRLQDDLKAAMRAGDILTRETVRMAIAAAKYRRIELGRDLTDEDLLPVLEKEVKKREDAAQQFAAAGRQDLAEKEKAEAGILGRYLPAKLDEAATRRVLEGLIAKLGIASKKDLGVLMKAVMAEHKGQVDGKVVQRLAGELLP